MMYTTFSISIFIILTLFSNVSSKRGKALLFLQSHAFEGDPPEADDTDDDPTSVDSAASHKVLFGHYSAILENSQRNSGSKTKNLLAGRSLNSKLGKIEGRRKSQISKIIEIYRKNFFLAIKSAVNITSGSKSSEFLSKLESCKEALKTCDGLGDLEIRCAVECLGKGHEIFSGLTDAITTLVDQFCLPINTIFDKFFEVKSKPKHPILRKFWVFLKRFTESKKPLLQLASQAAASLAPMIIDKIRTEYMPFRLFNEKLETELEAEEILQPGVTTESMTSNNLCTNVDDADVAEDLLDVLYRNPVLVDAILGGLSSLSLVTKYVPGRFQVPFAAASEGIRIMTGSICGLIEYAQTGNVPDCDQIGGFPVSGIPLPEIPEMPNLNPECLQGQAVNGDEKDDAGKNAFRLPESSTLSSGITKREVETEKKLEVEVKGVAGDDLSVKGISGNGSERKKKKKRHSLIVGRH